MVLKKIFTRRKVNLGPFNMYKKNRVRTHSSTPEKKKEREKQSTSKVLTSKKNRKSVLITNLYTFNKLISITTKNQQ